MARSESLLQGTLDRLVLDALQRRPMHDSAVAPTIHLLSDEVLTVEEGSFAWRSITWSSRKRDLPGGVSPRTTGRQSSKDPCPWPDNLRRATADLELAVGRSSTTPVAIKNEG